MKLWGYRRLPQALLAVFLHYLPVMHVACATENTSSPEDLEEIVVIGSGPARETLPGATVNREQLLRLPTGPRVQDVVKRLPGVVTGGGPGEDKDARALGLDKEYTRVIVDGMPLPDGGEKREFNLDRLSTTLVESIEISRNRRAEMEGDGIAGVVAIRQRAVPSKLEIESSAAAGLAEGESIQQWYTLVGGGMVNESLGMQGAFAWSETPIPKDKLKFDRTGLLQETEDESKTLTSTDMLGDMLWSWVDDELRFKPTLLIQREDKQKNRAKYKTGAYDGAEDEVEAKDKRTAGGSLTWQHDFTRWGNTVMEARLAYFRGDEDKEKAKRILRRDGVEDTARFETELEDKFDAIWQGELSFVRPITLGDYDHRIKAGMLARDKDRAKAKAKTRAGNSLAPGVKDIYSLAERVVAGYVQDRIAINSAIEIIPGVRVETASLQAQAGAGTARTGSTFDILPSLPLTIRFSERWSLNAGIARVINRPKFDSLIPFTEEKNDRTVIGNPDLAPEMGWSYDADLLFQSGFMQLGMGAFRRDIANRIEEVYIGQDESGVKSLFQARNVGDGWTQGIILSQMFSLADSEIPIIQGLALYAHQTLARSSLTEFTSGASRPFKEQPKLFGDLTVEWHDAADRISFSAGLNYVGKVAAAGEAGEERRPAELTVDAQARVRLTNKWEVFVLGENLTETRRTKLKADGSREIEQGARSFFAGLNARF